MQTLDYELAYRHYYMVETQRTNYRKLTKAMLIHVQLLMTDN